MPLDHLAKFSWATFFLLLMGCMGQFIYNSIYFTGPEINDHVNF